MDNVERKAFWNTLTSLEGKNLNEDSQTLAPLIHYPQSLYRFRPVNMKTLGALASNKMFFSTADHYDDPFDTFFSINRDRIEQLFNQAMNFLSVDENREGLHQLFQLTENDVQRMEYVTRNVEQTRSESSEALEQLREGLRERMASICFSEDVRNESLWLKYADQYCGFALEYSTNNLINDNRCYSDSDPREKTFEIYPIYYASDSEEKFDATDIILYDLYSRMLFWDMPELVKRQLLNMNVRLNPWDLTAVGLIKHVWHEHDLEWRIIPERLTVGREHFYMYRVPVSITLGLRMPESVRNLVVYCAQKAGIRNIRECYAMDGELKIKDYNGTTFLTN